MKNRLPGVLFILGASCLLAACGINVQNSGSNQNGSGNGQVTGPAANNASNTKDAFELASIINENSNIDLDLLSKAEYIEGKCSYVDGGDFSTLRYDGEVYAYAFPYPEDNGESYWTQIYVSGEGNDVLGIHVGDNLSDAIEAVSQYTMQ